MIDELTTAVIRLDVAQAGIILIIIVILVLFSSQLSDAVSNIWRKFNHRYTKVNDKISEGDSAIIRMITEIKEDIMTKLDNDNRRLNRVEHRIDTLEENDLMHAKAESEYRETIALIFGSLKAITKNQLKDNEDDADLQEAVKNMDDFLIQNLKDR